MDSVLADINIDDPSAIAGAEDAVKAPGVTSAPVEAKLRKEKKSKSSKRKSDAMDLDVDEQAVPAADSDAEERAAKKARKAEKKARKSLGRKARSQKRRARSPRSPVKVPKRF